MSKLEIGESSERTDSKYKGVRKRKWGKWVSEIRLPNCRERIWLGSYESPEKAARAFDAAQFCLRGRNAKFNFPENPPEIPGTGSLTTSEIQSIAAQFANEEPSRDSLTVNREQPETQVDYSYPSSSSVFDGTIPVSSDMSMDWSFLEMETTTVGSFNGMSDVGVFSGPLDPFSGDYFFPPLLDDDDGETGSGEFCPQQSFLWNF